MDQAAKARPIGCRFLLWAGFIFLCLYGAGLAVQWTLLFRQAIRDAERDAGLATELLAQDIISTAPLQSLMDGRDPSERYAALRNLVHGKLGKFGLREGKVYDTEGRILYADESSLVGERLPFTEEFAAALRGETASRILTEKGYEARYGVAAPTTAVETYVPVEEGGAVRFVVEAYKDFTPVRGQLVRTVVASAASFGAVVALALGALAWAYRRIHRLEAQVQTLESLLPICSYCKKIRVEEEGRPTHWVAVEQYFQDRDQVEFTHGICKDCMDLHMAEYRRKRQGPPP